MRDAGESAFPWRTVTVWFLAITTLLRLLQLPLLELAPDEAYYWDWSRRLSLGYYDQGPLIAYVIRLTTLIFGTNEFGVRIGVLAASFGTLFCCGLLARRFFSPRAEFLTVLLLGLTPLMEVGSLIATYDPLLVFCWAWTLLCLERALFASDLAAQRRGWYLAGIAAGMGFLSKHTMLLILPCLVLFLLLSKPHRFWLLRPEPYLAFGIVLLLYSGVFWWNIQHHWWTFRHLLVLAGKTTGTPLRRFGDYLGSQALLLGPLLFCGAVGVGVMTFLRSPLLRKGEQEKQPALSKREPDTLEPATTVRLFLVCMGLPVFAFFCLLTLKSKVQGNWSPCAWLTLTILLAATLSGQAVKMRASAIRWTAVIAATGGLLTLLLVTPGLRYALGIHLPPEADLSNTASGWRETAAYVQKVRERIEREGRRPVFVVSTGYQYTALLAFYLPDHPETFDLALHERLTMYAAYNDRLKMHLGQDALYLNDNPTNEADLKVLFESVEWESALPVWRRPYYTQPIRTMHVARCRNYRRYMGLEWTKGG